MKPLDKPERRTNTDAVAACLERDLDALLSCYDYPAWLRPKIRTTKAIERAFREVRRRTRPTPVFTNDETCERIVYALFAHLNAQWGRTRRRNSTSPEHEPDRPRPLAHRPRAATHRDD